MGIIKLGKTAPKFKLLNQDSKEMELSNFKGKKVIIYFYPKALTPGCTVQAECMNNSLKAFEKLGVVVLAISPDAPEKLLKFKDKLKLKFNLLSDPEHKVCEAYGVWQLKKFMGREFMGVVRTSFIVDENGKIVHVLEEVKTKTHHEVVLEIIKNL